MTTPEISTPEQLDEYRARSIDAGAFRWPSHSVDDTYQLQERRFCLIKKMVSLRLADEALGIPTEALLALIRGEAVVVQWQSIETAPKNKLLLVCQYLEDDRTPLPWFASFDGQIWYWEPGRVPSSVIPTHYMLPPPTPASPYAKQGEK